MRILGVHAHRRNLLTALTLIACLCCRRRVPRCARQLRVVLHAADISNPIRPFPVALAYAQRVQTEFKRQAEQERTMSLPVAPHMDAPDAATWAKMEVQFIDYIASPLWERLGQVGVCERLRSFVSD